MCHQRCVACRYPENLLHTATEKSQIFVLYPFSYFWLETSSLELIFVLSRASKKLHWNSRAYKKGNVHPALNLVPFLKDENNYRMKVCDFTVWQNTAEKVRPFIENRAHTLSVPQYIRYHKSPREHSRSLCLLHVCCSGHYLVLNSLEHVSCVSQP